MSVSLLLAMNSPMEESTIPIEAEPNSPARNREIRRAGIPLASEVPQLNAEKPTPPVNRLTLSELNA
jgi:hypothetical protein